MIPFERKITVFWLTRIFSALVFMVLVMAFIWHNELIIYDLFVHGGELTGVFTNGFFVTEPLVTQHIFMYLLVGGALLMATVYVLDTRKLVRLMRYEDFGEDSF